MSLHASKKSPEEILEEKILLLSFLSGVCFVIVELFYAHIQPFAVYINGRFI